MSAAHLVCKENGVFLGGRAPSPPARTRVPRPRFISYSKAPGINIALRDALARSLQVRAPLLLSRRSSGAGGNVPTLVIIKAGVKRRATLSRGPIGAKGELNGVARLPLA